MKIMTKDSEYGFEAVEVTLRSDNKHLELDIIYHDNEDEVNFRLNDFTLLSKRNVKSLIDVLNASYNEMEE